MNDRLEQNKKTAQAFYDLMFSNHVVLRCHQDWPGESEWAGIHIFRLDEDGKIVERWDVLQVVPRASANENTMF